MEMIPENNKHEISLFDHEKKAIDVRREMIKSTHVARSLTNIERYIFSASTNKQIVEISDDILTQKLSQMFKFIAMDIGYIIPNDVQDWAYICTRLMDLLKKYYSQLTLSEIKLAFELLLTGELDEFLSKDKEGKADRKHYQQFNADYFSKVLNAYVKKQNLVIYKAYKALPETNIRIAGEQILKFDKLIKLRIINIYLEYKYTDSLNLRVFDSTNIYNLLSKNGLVDDIEVTKEDKKKAMTLYMSRASMGFISQFQASNIRLKGIDHPELELTSIEFARKREIKKAFDRMIREEIYIYNIIKVSNE